MKKKNIVSLFLAGALLGGFAVTFTGCIDNDEPEGIKVLREAKAGLLSAKQALAAAEATKLQAEAQKALAEAEVAKAQAEIDKILAEANAAKIKAEAEATAAKTQAEADSIRAAAEAAAAKAEAEIEQIKAQTQAILDQNAEILAQLKLQTETAELEFKKALLSFETNEKQYYLESYYTNYLLAQNEYTTAYEAYIKAQADYLSVLGDVHANAYQTEKRFKDNLATAQKNLELKNKAIEDTEAEIELAAALEPDSLYERRDALKVTIEDLQSQLNNVDLELAQARYDNQEIYDSAKELQAAYNEAQEAKIEITPLTYTFPDLAVVKDRKESNHFTGEYTINEDLTFTLNDLTNYNKALNNIEAERTRLERALLDENDLRWASALVTEKTNNLTSYVEKYQADSAAWAEAVAVYNDGQPDITKFTDYAELVEALESLNSVIAEHNEYIAKLNEAYETYQEKEAAYKNYDDSFVKAIDAANDSRKEAQNVYDAALEKIDNELQDAIDKASKELTNAKNDEATAEHKAYAAEAALAVDPTSETLLAAKVAADKAYTDAQTATQEKQDAYDKLVNDKETSKEEAKKVPYATYVATLAEIDATYAKAIKDGEDEAKKQEKEQGKEDALNELIESEDAYESIWNRLFTDQTDEETGETIPSIVYTDYFNAYDQLINLKPSIVQIVDGKVIKAYTVDDNGDTDYNSGAFEESDDEYKSLKSWEISDFYVTLDKAKQNVLDTSEALYGVYDYDKDFDEVYKLPVAQLNELTQEEIDQKIALYDSDINAYQYYTLYEYFGSYGNLLYQQQSIEILKALAQNPDIVTEALAQFDEAYVALTASKDDQQALADAAKEAWDAQEEVVAAFEQEFTDKKIDLQGEINALQRIQSALQAVLGDEVVENHLSAGAIEGYQKRLEELKQEYEDEIPALEDAVALAEKILEGYQAGTIIAADAYEQLMNLQKENLDIKTETRDKAKAALDEAIAYLESL
jgi:hypothetical protein